MLPVHFTSNKLELPVSNTPRGFAGMQGRNTIDAVSVSASRDASGKIHITLVNCDPNKEQPVECDLGKVAAKSVSGKVLTSAKISDHNTFENPDNVTVKDFRDAKIDKGVLTVLLPSKSVVMLKL
jgi:alpha-N-arabinofuranosidase